jgi:hypothetical protein
MRKKLALVVGIVAAANLTVFAAPAHACHDIMTSENPIHNWICATVHDVVGH